MEMDVVEFWKNFFLKQGGSRTSLDDFSIWMRQGFSGFDQMTAFFQKACGFDQLTKGSIDLLQVMKKSQEDFQKSISTYLAMIGGVPRGEHLDLIRKYEELKEQVTSQKETIKHLRTLLAEEKKVEHKELTGQMQDLIHEQSRQFKRLMENFKQEKPEAQKPVAAAVPPVEAPQAKKSEPEPARTEPAKHQPAKKKK